MMTNPEVRCASTKLEVPNFHAEVEASARAADSRVKADKRLLAINLFVYAADQLDRGKFASAEEALEFVFDGLV